MPTTAEKNIILLPVTTDDGYFTGFVGGVAKSFDSREFKRGRRAIATTTSAAYNLAASDEGKMVVHTSASNSTITILADGSLTWVVGGAVEIMRNGAGTLTVAAGSGVTLSAAGRPKARVQGSVMLLRKIAANSWVLTGDTTA